ncbi:MAG: thrombospondin type 3 repeat-containing protein, partial [Elusimicrobiota bacterium]
MKTNNFVSIVIVTAVGLSLAFAGRAGALDSDYDGILDDVDNCPTVANPTQADLDGDEPAVPSLQNATEPDLDDTAGLSLPPGFTASIRIYVHSVTNPYYYNYSSTVLG